jgi:hypothetical protein
MLQETDPENRPFRKGDVVFLEAEVNGEVIELRATVDEDEKPMAEMIHVALGSRRIDVPLENLCLVEEE